MKYSKLMPLVKRHFLHNLPCITPSKSMSIFPARIHRTTHLIDQNTAWAILLMGRSHLYKCWSIKWLPFRDNCCPPRSGLCHLSCSSLEKGLPQIPWVLGLCSKCFNLLKHLASPPLPLNQHLLERASLPAQWENAALLWQSSRHCEFLSWKEKQAHELEL